MAFIDHKRLYENLCKLSGTVHCHITKMAIQTGTVFSPILSSDLATFSLQSLKQHLPTSELLASKVQSIISALSNCNSSLESICLHRHLPSEHLLHLFELPAREYHYFTTLFRLEHYRRNRSRILCSYCLGKEEDFKRFSLISCHC